MSVQDRLSGQLRRFRTKNNLSQQALAKQVGCQRMQIWRWEKGASFPSPKFLDLLADTLGVDITALLQKMK